MEETKIPCACCGHPVGTETWPVCAYCGYVHVAVVGSTTRYDRRARAHREGVIAKLTDISVLAFRYGWTGQAYGLLEERELPLADGPACDGTIFWTGQRFGQPPGKDPIPIRISFCYDGRRQRVTWNAQPPAGGGCWDIGLEIDGHLELAVYLGSGQAAVKCRPIQFLQEREGSE